MIDAIASPTSPSRVELRSWLALVFAPAVPQRPAHAYSVRIDRPIVDVVTGSDVQDVRRSLNGDDDAFERIVRRHQQEIAGRLRRFSRDPLVLEELVQETFVQAYFSLRRYRSDAPLIHWLHRIAVRAGYRYWKSRRDDPPAVPLDARTPASTEASGGDADRLERVMDRLAPRDRLVLTLLYLEDRTVQETAALIGWSRTMVKVQAHRARGRLRRLMRRRGVMEPP